jgi:hypothetical protein
VSTNLSDRLDESFAEAWKPEPGDKLIGVVTELAERENEYGRYPIVTVRTEDGDELAFHAFRTVAKNELARCRPEVGDRIGIKYLGKPEGKEYELYRIKVERDESQAAALDWNAYAGDEPEDAGPGEDEADDPSRQGERPDDDDIPF